MPKARDCFMELIDRYLPHYHFSEVHSLYMAASPGRVLDVVNRPDVVDDVVVRSLISLRELPSRLFGRLGFASNLQRRVRRAATAPGKSVGLWPR